MKTSEKGEQAGSDLDTPSLHGDNRNSLVFTVTRQRAIYSGIPRDCLAFCSVGIGDLSLGVNQPLFG